MKRKVQGITLISLIITIIVLLILAGITIIIVNSKILNKAKNAEEITNYKTSKEIVEIKINEAIITCYSKNLDVSLENIKNEFEEDSEFTVEKIFMKNIADTQEKNISIQGFVISVNSYPKYKYLIGENLKIVKVIKREISDTISIDDFIEIEEFEKMIFEGKSFIDTTTKVSYTVSTEKFTKDNVTIKMIVSNDIGIKTIEYPNKEIINCNGVQKKEIEIPIDKNGTYIFKIKDNKDEEESEEIKIDNIDKLLPNDFTPTVEHIVIDKFTVKVNTDDAEATETNAKSGIWKYEYYIKETKDTQYTKYESQESQYEFENLTAGKTYNFYVTVYDNANNSKTSQIEQVTTMNKIAIPDTVIDYNKSNITTQALQYPLLTSTGVKNCAVKPANGTNMTITIQNQSYEDLKHYYSLDGGSTWTEYKQPVTTPYKGDDLIKVKSIYNGNISSDIKSFAFTTYTKNNSVNCTASDALGIGAYDGNISTFAGYVNTATGNPVVQQNTTLIKYVQIDDSAIGKKVNITWEDCSSFATTITMKFYNQYKNYTYYSKEQRNVVKSTDSITITSGMKWIQFTLVGGYISHARVYEITI